MCKINMCSGSESEVVCVLNINVKDVEILNEKKFLLNSNYKYFQVCRSFYDDMCLDVELYIDLRVVKEYIDLNSVYVLIDLCNYIVNKDIKKDTWNEKMRITSKSLDNSLSLYLDVLFEKYCNVYNIDEYKALIDDVLIVSDYLICDGGIENLSVTDILCCHYADVILKGLENIK